MTSKADVRVRRIYDEPEDQDGIRVLVDRRWPRGVTKAKAALDEWCKTVAPATALRTWYATTRPSSTSSPAATAAELEEPEPAELGPDLLGGILAECLTQSARSVGEVGDEVPFASCSLLAHDVCVLERLDRPDQRACP